MVQKKGTVLTNITIKLRNGKNSAIRFLLGGIARIRFGKTIFDKRDLEVKFAAISSSKFIGIKMLEEIITKNINEYNENIIFEKLNASLINLKKDGKEKPMKDLYVAGLRALGAIDLPLSIKFGEYHLSSIEDHRGIKSLILFYCRCGYIKKPYSLLSKLDDSKWKNEQNNKLKRELNLLEKGIVYENKNLRTWESNPRNIMYHVNQSLPHHSSGYAIRTQSLLRALKKKKWNIEAYARIGYPNDRYDFIGARIVKSHSNVESIDYNFTPSRTKSIGKLSIEQYQKESVKLIIEQAKKFKPAIIHCASNYSCGLAGTAAAKLLGIPSIYEMRGLWHMTRTAKQPEYADTDHYKMIEKLEIQAAMNADHVFTITNGIKEVLLKNGIEDRKITLLPNAVDTERFKSNNRNKLIEKKLGLEGKKTIGYIGSFTDYEGLDYLLRASVNLKEKYNGKFKILLIGDGTALDDLKRLRTELKLEDTVHFTGRIDHNDVLDYYSVIDIAVYPRKGTPVCEIVSPLKPLEAMAMGKIIIASSVKALAEMVIDKETGMIHIKDDIDDLSRLLEICLTNKDLNEKLGKNAIKWVTLNRTWDEISKKVNGAYQKLIRRSDMDI